MRGRGGSEGEACVYARCMGAVMYVEYPVYECDLICGGSDVIGAVRVSIRAHTLTHTHTHTR